jgi:hypothetical protein
MKFWYYFIRSIWRVVNGRWYVWRDAPTDVVRQAAALKFEAAEDKDTDPILASVMQADAEASLRKLRKGETK